MLWFIFIVNEPKKLSRKQFPCYSVATGRYPLTKSPSVYPHSSVPATYIIYLVVPWHRLKYSLNTDMLGRKSWFLHTKKKYSVRLTLNINIFMTKGQIGFLSMDSKTTYVGTFIGKTHSEVLLFKFKINLNYVNGENCFQG